MKTYRNIGIAVAVIFVVSLVGLFLNPDMAPDLLNFKLEPDESNTLGTIYAIAVFVVAMGALVIWNIKNIVGKIIEIFKKNNDVKDVK